MLPPTTGSPRAAATWPGTRQRGARILRPVTAGLVPVVLVAWLMAAGATRTTVDARGHTLGPGPATSAYPWATEPDPTAPDRWGFTMRQCTSYVAWYLNSHGVPVARRTWGPAGLGVFDVAGDWDRGAADAGFAVSRRPVVGSIAQWRSDEHSPTGPISYEANRYLPYRDQPHLIAGPSGHVAVVVTVLRDGSVLVAGYNGGTRRLQLLHTRAPRYLYIGVGAASPGTGVTIAADRAACPAALCR